MKRYASDPHLEPRVTLKRCTSEDGAANQCILDRGHKGWHINASYQWVKKVIPPSA